MANLNSNHTLKVKQIIEKLPESPQKNLIILLFVSQDEENSPFLEQLCPRFSINLEELMAQGVLNLSRP